MKYIPLNECNDGFLYIISARNAKLGIFCKEDNSFIIRRANNGPTFIFKDDKWIKDGPYYLSKEYHWDTGEPFGTAKPLIRLGPTGLSFLPELDDSQTLSFLAMMDKNETYKQDIENALHSCEL